MKKARELSLYTYDIDTAEEIVVAVSTVYFNLLDLLEKRLLPD